MANKSTKKTRMGRFRWLYPGVRLKRWGTLLIVSMLFVGIGSLGVFGDVFHGIHIRIDFLEQFVSHARKLKFIDILLVTLGLIGAIFAYRRGLYSVLSIFRPHSGQGEVMGELFRRARLRRGPHVVALGGGTGLPSLLKGLKEYTSNITAVVTVGDDGGSSGRLRRDFKILPPGDIRNCLMALADTEPLMERLFQHRFRQRGDLKGHSFGNLFITAMTEVTGDFRTAMKESSKVLAIQGDVVPVTYQNMILKAKLADGRVVEGQSKIGQSGNIQHVFLKSSRVKASPEALSALRQSEAIVLGPGSLFTSVLPDLLIPDVTRAINDTHAVKVYICNVMTQLGETDDFSAADHLEKLLENSGLKELNYVLVNDSEIPSRLLKKYAREGACPVVVDQRRLEKLGVRVIKGDFLSESDYARHDPYKLAKAIMRLILI